MDTHVNKYVVNCISSLVVNGDWSEASVTFCITVWRRSKQTLYKRMLFNKTIQYTHFNKIIVFKYTTKQIKTKETNK